MIQVSPYLVQQLRSEFAHISTFLQDYGSRDTKLQRSIDIIGNAIVAHSLSSIQSMGSPQKMQKYLDEQDVQVFKLYLKFLAGDDDDDAPKRLKSRVWFDFSKYQPHYKEVLPKIPKSAELQYTDFNKKSSKDTSELILENMNNVLANLDAIYQFVQFISRECVRRDDFKEDFELIFDTIYKKKTFIRKEKMAMLVLRGDTEELNQLRHELFQEMGRYSTSHLFSSTFTHSSYSDEHKLKTEMQRRVLTPIGEKTTPQLDTSNAVSDLLGM